MAIIDLLRPGKPAAPVVSAPQSPGRQASTSTSQDASSLCSCTRAATMTILEIPAAARPAVSSRPNGPSGARRIRACPRMSGRRHRIRSRRSTSRNTGTRYRWTDPRRRRLFVFDYGVNSGIGRAAQVLRRASGGTQGPHQQNLERTAGVSQAWGLGPRSGAAGRRRFGRTGSARDGLSTPSSSPHQRGSVNCKESTLETDSIVGWMKGPRCAHWKAQRSAKALMRQPRQASSGFCSGVLAVTATIVKQDHDYRSSSALQRGLPFAIRGPGMSLLSSLRAWSWLRRTRAAARRACNRQP